MALPAGVRCAWKGKGRPWARHCRDHDPDYFLYRRRQLDLNDLYQLHGRYRYTGGFSGVAIAALVLSVLPIIPGFLATIKVIPQSSVAPVFLSIYRYAWFVGFALAFIFHLLLRGITGSRGPANDVILSEAKRSRRIPLK